jgi:hypothetical protein
VANQPFDPTSIAQFSVIRIPYTFEGRRSEKLFVVLCRRGAHIICIKATSKTEIYKNNQDKMKGCIYYPAGSLDCFPQDTAVQPDNQIPISDGDLRKAFAEGVLKIYPPPENFEQELRKAIRNSYTLDERHRECLIAAIGKP